MARVTLLAVVLAACAHPAPRAPASSDPLAPTIDKVAAYAIDHHDTAGMSVAILRGGQVTFARGYGEADREAHVAVTADTVFRIGSVTKQFTAAAILQLAEAGKLKLDDDVRTYVDVPTGGRTVTIAQLLHHTSGIPDYTDLPGYAAAHSHRLAPAEILAMVAAEPWGFDPGTRWAYSNTGYVVLGMVIEKVSGTPYATYLAANVFSRAGLTATSYCDESRPDPHRARGYDTGPGGAFATAAAIDMSVPFAAGALCSTASDLARWSWALSHGRVVSPADFTAMTTSHGLAGQPPYGLGLQLGDVLGHRAVFHNGGIDGFVSELHTYPDDDVTVVVLTNTVSAAATSSEAAIAGVALHVVTTTATLAASAMPAYAGTYDLPPLGDVVVAVDGDRLIVAPPKQPRFPLEYAGGDRFVITALGAILEFTRDPTTHAVTALTIEQGGAKLTGRRK